MNKINKYFIMMILIIASLTTGLLINNKTTNSYDDLDKLQYEEQLQQVKQNSSAPVINDVDVSVRDIGIRTMFVTLDFEANGTLTKDSNIIVRNKGGFPCWDIDNDELNWQSGVPIKLHSSFGLWQVYHHKSFPYFRSRSYTILI